MQTKELMTTRKLTILGFLIAVCIVCSRYLSINITTSIRFSLTNAFLILTGLWFGPVSGAVVGVTADILGSFLSGYTPFLPLTVSPLLVGVMAGAASRFIRGRKPFLPIIITVFLITLVTTLLYSSWALSLLYGSPYTALLLSRIPQAAVACILHSLIILLLYRSPLTRIAAETA